jgi:hypothetical protein
MIQQTSFKRRYTCGQHVTGHGRHIATHGIAIRSGKECAIETGVIVMLSGKREGPYTVLDQQTFITLEAQEEHLTALP